MPFQNLQSQCHTSKKAEGKTSTDTFATLSVHQPYDYAPASIPQMTATARAGDTVMCPSGRNWISPANLIRLAFDSDAARRNAIGYVRGRQRGTAPKGTALARTSQLAVERALAIVLCLRMVSLARYAESPETYPCFNHTVAVALEMIGIVAPCRAPFVVEAMECALIRP